MQTQHFFGLLLMLFMTQINFSLAEESQHMDHSPSDHTSMQDYTDAIPQMDHAQDMREGHGSGMRDTRDEHQNHQNMQHSPVSTITAKDKLTLKPLVKLPDSGKSRENGFDGKYAMESNVLSESLELQCAKGSRGLIMLDNSTWQKCGGKPKGLSTTRATSLESVEPMQHMQH